MTQHAIARHWWVSLLMFASAAVAGAEPPQAATFDRAALQADVDVLQSAYQTLHPGLLRYNTQAQIDAHFRALRKALDGARTLPQAYLAFSEFAAKVQCGHTYANFSNQPDAIRTALFEGTHRVPFEFRWLDGRMVVTRDLTPDHALPRGTTVESIDGIPTSRILSTLLRIARADGGNDAKRIALLEVQGAEKWETFDIFLPLYFPQIGAVQRLAVRSPEGETRTVEVNALTLAQRLAARPDNASTHAGWTFDAADDRIAVLRMPTWALYNDQWDWKAFVRASFDTLGQRKPAALVIDLRNNEGGVDVGEELLPYLITKPATLHAPKPQVRYRKVPDALAPMLDTWDDSFKDWGAQAQGFDGRFYTLHRWDDGSGTRVIQPRAPHFAGDVYVLVGPGNSSATFEFAQQVRALQVGKLVGRTTGGNQRGINGGAFFFLRLPNTHIELDVPLIARFVDGAPDGGLPPDVPVAVTVADIAAGRDAEMEAVRQWMAGKP